MSREDAKVRLRGEMRVEQARRRPLLRHCFAALAMTMQVELRATFSTVIARLDRAIQYPETAVS
ncbi:hypothetical protein XI08_27200 [Bradyrhizobium sp. CCBAU 11361]|nr:hypothetical protein [Bradyrhizobium sp. CCBAU 11361]